MLGKKGKFESPWLPLLKKEHSRQSRFLGWLRANHAWLLSIVAVSVAAISAYSSIRNTDRADERFRQEHRPWLVTRIAKDTLSLQLASYLAVPYVRNVGPGPAIWFKGRGLRFDSRVPIARVLWHESAGTSRMLPPGDSAIMMSSAIPLDTAPPEADPFYYHYVLCYGGTTTGETLYLEQVFHVDPSPQHRDGGSTQLPNGEECAYIGRVKSGAVVLDGWPAPDTEARTAASLVLDSLLTRHIPKAPSFARQSPRDARASLVQYWLRALRDSSLRTICTESLRYRRFQNDAVEFAWARAKLYWRTALDTLTDPKARLVLRLRHVEGKMGTSPTSSPKRVKVRN